MGVIMGEPIKGHMTRVDRLRARGQFVHSVQNKSIKYSVIPWHVSFLLQVAHVELSSRVVSSMKCVLQVVRHTEHIALYRTIVYC